MIEWEIHLDLMVLQYVKKNKLTVDQFEKHVNDISYGFDLETGNHEDTYRNKRMITSGDNYNLVLTSFGEAILKNSEHKNNKEWVQTLAPVGALIITTITLVYSVILGF